MHQHLQHSKVTCCRLSAPQWLVHSLVQMHMHSVGERALCKSRLPRTGAKDMPACSVQDADGEPEQVAAASL